MRWRIKIAGRIRPGFCGESCGTRSEAMGVCLRIAKEHAVRAELPIVSVVRWHGNVCRLVGYEVNGCTYVVQRGR